MARFILLCTALSLPVDDYALLHTHGRQGDTHGLRGKPIISFRIRPDIKGALQKLAAADRRSVSSYIELALEGHIKRKGGKPAGKRK